MSLGRSPRKNETVRERIERSKSRTEFSHRKGDKYGDEDALGALRSPIRDGGRNMRRCTSPNKSNDEIVVDQTEENDKKPRRQDSPHHRQRMHKYSTTRQRYHTTPEKDPRSMQHSSNSTRKSLNLDDIRAPGIRLGPGEELEDDPIVLARKQKTIMYGKNTEGYERYCVLFPKHKRRRIDPKTPEKYVKCTRRSWDQQVKIWRRKLHTFDPPEGLREEDWENLDPGDAFDIDIDTCDEVSSISSTNVSTSEVVTLDSAGTTPSPTESRALTVNDDTLFNMPCPFVPKNTDSQENDEISVKMSSPRKITKKTVTLNWRASLGIDDSNDSLQVKSPVKSVNKINNTIFQENVHSSSQDSFPDSVPFDFSCLKGTEKAARKDPGDGESSKKVLDFSGKFADFSSHAMEMSDSSDGFNAVRRSPRKKATVSKPEQTTSLGFDYDLKGLSWADLADSSNSNV